MADRYFATAKMLSSEVILGVTELHNLEKMGAWIPPVKNMYVTIFFSLFIGCSAQDEFSTSTISPVFNSGGTIEQDQVLGKQAGTIQQSKDRGEGASREMASTPIEITGTYLACAEVDAASAAQIRKFSCKVNSAMARENVKIEWDASFPKGYKVDFLDSDNPLEKIIYVDTPVDVENDEWLQNMRLKVRMLQANGVVRCMAENMEVALDNFNFLIEQLSQDFSEDPNALSVVEELRGLKLDEEIEAGDMATDEGIIARNLYFGDGFERDMECEDASLYPSEENILGHQTSFSVDLKSVGNSINLYFEDTCLGSSGAKLELKIVSGEEIIHAETYNFDDGSERIKITNLPGLYTLTLSIMPYENDDLLDDGQQFSDLFIGQIYLGEL
tara:strand:+ start:111 stop:1271 length:1161 start_codon:yes stop_codon:yes gene_type:complete